MMKFLQTQIWNNSISSDWFHLVDHHLRHTHILTRTYKQWRHWNDVWNRYRSSTTLHRRHHWCPGSVCPPHQRGPMADYSSWHGEEVISSFSLISCWWPYGSSPISTKEMHLKSTYISSVIIYFTWLYFYRVKTIITRILNSNVQELNFFYKE